MHACKCVQTVHHISNLTLRSGSVFVRKAAPTVEACEQVGTTTEFAIFEDCRWPGQAGFSASVSHLVIKELALHVT